MRRIYFTGASGVGKTTLAKWVSEHYKIPLVTGAARGTLVNLGISNPSEFFKSASSDEIEDFHRKCFEKQFHLESSVIVKQPDVSGYVSDRTIIDHMAYIAMQGFGDLARHLCRECGDYDWALRRIAHPDTAVFFVRSYEKIRITAFDGVRDQFLAPDTQFCFDQSILVLLSVLRIPHTEITEPELDKRKELILKTIGDWK